jgi:hypothetical protein
MVIGQTILYIASGYYYSPTFARGGPSALFAADVYLVAGGPTLVVEVEHKNQSDTTWSTAGTFGSITAAGIATVSIGALKEVLRFRYSFSGGTAGDFFHLSMLAPAWQED